MEFAAPGAVRALHGAQTSRGDMPIIKMIVQVAPNGIVTKHTRIHGTARAGKLKGGALGLEVILTEMYC